MDKNSIIGLLLIGAILIGFTYYNAPTEAEIAAQKRSQDSIAFVEQKKDAERKLAVAQSQTKETNVVGSTSTEQLSDSAKAIVINSQYGIFANTVNNENKTYTIENELIKVTVAAKGGRVSAVELKEYKDNAGAPLQMMDVDSSRFGLTFFVQNRVYTTDSLLFKGEGASFSVNKTDSNSLAMRLYAAPDKYIEYLYSLKGNSYLVGCKINFVGFQDLIPSNTSDVALNWNVNLVSQEKSKDNQRNASTIYYKFLDDEVDYLSETKDKKESLTTKVKWLAFKQQYFTQALIADESFDKPTDIETVSNKESNYVKNMSAAMVVPFGHREKESFGMTFYFGPNHYQTLKQYNLGLEKLIPLGWGILGWINRFCVIPIFNFLDSFNISYGIIILILTIIIKVVLLPLTYKAYMSTAKMKILKPEIDEINKKYEKDDAMKKQQAIMGLYKKAGVNPLGGCIPMLLQMPILLAMFRFFPASIELRQQPFLWATDLSTYDSIWDFGFSIPFYGDHVSLFTLLMTVSTILYTRMNSQLTGGDDMMQKQMKWMMYLMPIIFLGVFNNYAAGLSYYYFLANMFTFGQQYLIKRFVDEDKLHKQIQDNKKKPVNLTKSKFQQKLEDMAKQRGAQLPSKKK